MCPSVQEVGSGKYLSMGRGLQSRMLVTASTWKPARLATASSSKPFMPPSCIAGKRVIMVPRMSGTWRENKKNKGPLLTQPAQDNPIPPTVWKVTAIFNIPCFKGLVSRHCHLRVIPSNEHIPMPLLGVKVGAATHTHQPTSLSPSCTHVHTPTA